MFHFHRRKIQFHQSYIIVVVIVIIFSTYRRRRTVVDRSSSVVKYVHVEIVVKTS